MFMIKAVFDKNLETGSELIDSQHRELIDRINILIDSFGDKAKAIEMLDYLTEYTDFHFSAEEKLQEDIKYPDIERHRAQHASFVETVAQLREKLEKEGPTEEFAKLVNDRVIQWLYGHIKVFDRAIADFQVYRGSANNDEKMG